jgi:hypothetical protein
MKIKNVFIGVIIFLSYIAYIQTNEKIKTVLEIAPQLKFHGTRQTLDKIKYIISSQQKGAYLRFGDGDIVLAYGGGDLMQTANIKLQQEMKEAFGLEGENVLKTLPLHNKEIGTYEPGMFPGNHEANLEQCINFLKKVKPLWQGEISNVYSLVALHHLAIVDQHYVIDFLKFMRNANCCLFIGNEKVPDHIKTLLWGPMCRHIKTPSANAFNSIDRIEQECYANIVNDGTYKVIIVAMGCSGRVLVKRLWKNLDNIFFFDFGSLLDALCGWNTRAWIELTKFDHTTFIAKLKAEFNLV